MKFILILFSTLLLPVIIYAQKLRKEGAIKTGYLIKGNLFNGRERKIYLVEINSWNQNGFQDSTVVDKEGKFSFTGKVKEPLYCKIKTADSTKAGISFYLENSVINIDGNVDSLWLATLRGSKEEDVRQEYQSKLWLASRGGFIKVHNDIISEYRKAKSKSDTLAMKILDKKKEIFYLNLGDSIKKLIKKHPLSIASVDAVSYFIDKHRFSDQNFSEPDSLLKVFEKSPIKHYQQLQFLRRRLISLKLLVIGNFAPDFKQNDASGNPISLSSYKGKYLLLDFWASWCKPCREQNPKLVNLYKTYKDQNFTIVSISLDENKKKWLDAIEKDHLLWTNISDLKGRQNGIALQYGVNGIPFNLLLDPEGKIIAIDIVGEQLSEKLKKIFLQK